MSAIRSLAFAIVVLAMAALPMAAPRQAAAQGAKATKIDLTTSPALDDHGRKIKGQYTVAATVTTADGRFVPNAKVQFVEVVEFFGKRSADLGSAVTDNTGYAAVTYQPSQVGPHTLTARFDGSQQYAAAQANVALNATSVVPPFTPAAQPLAGVGQWLSYSLAVVGIAFWAVLLGVLIRAVRRIRAISDREEPSAIAGMAVASGSRD